MRKNICILWMTFCIIHLQAQDTLKTLEYYLDFRYISAEGIEIACASVPGKPPAIYRSPAAIPSSSSVMLDSVPAYSWSFGCSNTSAAMVAGFYDNHGYPDIYTAITNDGLAPMDNILWGTVTINGETRNQCPISATMLGLDERVERGHVDDFWICYRNYGPDPYLANGWIRHPDGDCTGDFMGTNQSVFGNADGNTRFFFLPDGNPLYNYTGNEPFQRDGCHGMRLFYESRGYVVLENYTQLIQGMYGNSTGFTFEQYKEEIDNGRPVILQLAGHSMLGLGYDSAANLVYLHDTWDYSLHSMTWGGAYAGMTHWGVTVVRLASDNPPPLADFSSNAVSVYTGQYVQFFDLSSYNPSAWEWTFEGGSPGNSTQQNPLVTYSIPGIYPVKLRASNLNGYDTELKPGWIAVMQPTYVKILEINLLLEGLYNPTSGEMNKTLHDQGAVFPATVADVITICLSLPDAIANPLYCLENMPLHQNGLCTVYLPDSLSGSFYILITHRNSLETWSSHPVNICSDSTSYDFTDNAGKAFGNNLKEVDNVFCLYSGDINQDGIIDSGDLIALDNAIQSFASGYLPEDINGDGMPDLEDLMIIEENAGFFVVKKVPD